MRANGDVPVIECVNAAYAFLASRWREAIRPAMVPAIAGGAMTALSAGSPGAPALLLLAMVVSLYAEGSVFGAAAIRGAFDRATPIRLSFGPEVNRLFVARLGVFLVTFLLVVGAMIGLAILVTLLAEANGAPLGDDILTEDGEQNAQAMFEALGAGGQVALFVGLILAFVAVVFVQIRFVLVGAATIAEGRTMVFETWSWTRGNAWRIFAALLMTQFPATALLLIASEILRGLLSPLGAPIAAVVSGFVLAGAGAVVVGMLREGLAVYLYKGLRPSAEPSVGAS